MLNEYDMEHVLKQAKDCDFPAAIVFHSRGISSWDPDVVPDYETLVEYLFSEKCPWWKGAGGEDGVDLISVGEAVPPLIAPEHRADVDIENMFYDMLPGDIWDLYDAIRAEGYEVGRDHFFYPDPSALE